MQLYGLLPNYKSLTLPPRYINEVKTIVKCDFIKIGLLGIYLVLRYLFMTHTLPLNLFQLDNIYVPVEWLHSFV